MNRRGFFAALAAIPFVGKLVPKQDNTTVMHFPGDMPYRYERKTPLPKVQWRRINKGVSPRED